MSESFPGRPVRYIRVRVALLVGTAVIGGAAGFLAASPHAGQKAAAAAASMVVYKSQT